VTGCIEGIQIIGTRIAVGHKISGKTIASTCGVDGFHLWRGNETHRGAVAE
jgi:hypothetical protein